MNSFSIETSKDNYEILKVNKNGKDIYIGSKYNQQREIDKFIKSFNEFTENDIYIIFGASMFEHIEALKKVNKNFKKIIVVEVNTGIRNLIEERILLTEKIKIVSSLKEVKESIIANIDDVNINYVKIGYYSNYDKVYSVELKEIAQFIKDICYSIICNRNTNIYFAETWFDSLINNLKYMKKSTPINHLKDRFKNVPAIIVSAGPSLSKNIESLASEKKALILTGGRTLTTLLENKIDVDYLGIVDPGVYSYQLVEKHIGKIDIPLVYYNGTNQMAVEKHKGKKIFSTDNTFIREVFNEKVDNIGNGGSVAHFLTEFALYTGCNPIIFIGQDLAYTGEKAHDQNALTNGNDKNIAWKQAGDLYVDDINGKKVRTSVVLNDFRLHLEKIIKLNSNKTFINATEGGAKIKGTIIAKLSDVMKKLDTLEAPNYKEQFIETDLFDEKMKEYICMLNEINKKTECGIILIDKLECAVRKKDDMKINYFIEKLNKIDNYILENMKKLAILQNKMFAEIYEINNSPLFVINNKDSEKNKIIKNFSKNKAIYIVMNKHSKDAKEKIENTFGVS